MASVSRITFMIGLSTFGVKFFSPLAIPNRQKKECFHIELFYVFLLFSFCLAGLIFLCSNPDEYIEYDTSLVGSGVVERTGLVMKATEVLVVQVSSATPTISVVAMGIETSTA